MKIIILAIEISIILIEIIRFHYVLKKIFGIKPGKRVKPFDCLPCLSMWISVGLLFVPGYLINYGLIIATTAIIGQLISMGITGWKLKK